MIGVVFFALTIPLSAWLADKRGGRAAMMFATVLIFIFGLFYATLFAHDEMAFMILGMCVVGITYGPLGTVLAQIFPTAVRYTGSSLAFNFAGIFGASLAPYAATWLANRYGLAYVGYYLSAAAVLTMLALIFKPKPEM
jgi:MFS family permease